LPTTASPLVVDLVAFRVVEGDHAMAKTARQRREVARQRRGRTATDATVTRPFRRSRALVAVAGVVFVLMLAACGSSSGDAAAPTGATTSPAGSASGQGTSGPGVNARAVSEACGPAAEGASAPRSTHTARPVEVGGAERQVREFLPASYGTTPAPVVIQLHGYLSGAEGQIAMSAIEPVAESGGFVVLSPQGNGERPYWNAVPHADLPDDVAFVDALIDDVVATRCVDPTRIYVMGLSNGAFLASLVACRLSNRVAGVAAVAGLQSPADCAPADPVPMLAIHGTDDRFVPADGTRGPALEDLPFDADSTRAFDGLPWAPVRTSAQEWAARNGCEATPATSSVSPSVTEVEYGGCRDDADVVLYEVAGGGHTWPGSRFSQASAGVLGPTTTEIDANTVIWDFFRAHQQA
jgi:polyhydroxybutyrate depolymerase